MKPSGLANSCTRCGHLMPYDPKAENQLCNSCNRIVAFGGSISLPSSNHGRHQSDFATPQPTMAYPTQQNMSQFHTPQLLTMELSYHDDTYSRPLQPAMPSANLKRKHESSVEELQFPNKRSAADVHAPHTPSTLRQSVWPPTFDSQDAMALKNEAGEDEDEDDFVDAQEDQHIHAEGVDANLQVDEQAAGAEEVDQTADEASKQPETIAIESDDEASNDRAAGEGVDDEDDLFAQTFGNSASGEADDHESDHDNAAAPTSPPQDFNRAAFLSSLRGDSPTNPTTTNTTTNPSTSTKPKKNPFRPAHKLGTLPLLVPKYLANNLRKQATFHTTSLHYLPRLPLAAHRYWIGVLKLNVPPRTSSQSEKNYTWMKGNRFTTIETIRNAFVMAAAAAEVEGEGDGEGDVEGDEQGQGDGAVVLLCGYERPGLRTRVEELDWFGDRKVILRAVGRGHKDAQGRGLGEELVRVVEEEEDGKEGDGKGEERGVIEID